MTLSLLLLLLLPPGDVHDTPLADEPFSRMSLTHKKGFLFIQVNVLELEIRFGRRETERFRELLEGRRNLSATLEQEVVATAISADEARIEVRFLRDISLGRFIREARSSTKLAYQSGIIPESELKRVNENLPKWYASLRGRGIRKLDRMSYRIQHQSLHTVYTGAEGKVYVDQIDEGVDPGRTVLGGYLTPGSEFRSGLLQSLIESGS